MRTVLAALDTTAAARPVVETARGIGLLMDATVEALHVGDRPVEMLETLTAQHQMPLRVMAGEDVTAAVLEAVEASGVVAAVVGARAAPGGRRPTGRTALAVVERTRKPTVVVPPDFASGGTGSPRRLLIPLEGSPQSSQPVLEGLLPLVASEVELVALHVFTPATMPHVLDRPQRDLELIGTEFLAQYCPHATRLEWRTGPVGTQVCDVCATESADLIVLSWSQDSSAGRAAVVRHVLADATIPVLLLPLAEATTEAASSSL